MLGDQARRGHQRRRKVRVLVHRAVFLSGGGHQSSPLEHFFIKVTNLSPKREVEVTHIWFATEPPVNLINFSRPLPARLRLDETFETWILAGALHPDEAAERLVRVQLSNGKIVKSRLNKNVPPVGHVAGPGSH